MEALTRKRRTGVAADLEGASLNLDSEYITALSQPEAREAPASGPRPGPGNGEYMGEASPGALEASEAQGSAPGVPLIQANPFHSDKVKMEVELALNRPASLDKEALRLGLDTSEEGLEPDYAAAFGNPTDSGTRVASMDAGHGHHSEYVAASGNPTDSGARVARVEAGQGCSATAAEPHVAPGLDPLGSLMGLQGEVKSGPAGVQPTGWSQGPAQDDTRELVPDKGISSQVEPLLTQVMEENRTLRKRLEQVELRSHSSWHSGQGEGAAGLSPVSFTVEGGQRFLDPVQQWSSLGRFVGSQLGAPYGAPSINLSGPQASLGGHMGVSGEQQSLEGTRAPELQVGGPGFPSVQGFGPSELQGGAGLAGVNRFDLVPFVQRELPSASYGTGVRSDPVAAVSPPPLPIAAPAVRQDSSVAMPQSVRQFAPSSGVEASGLGQGVGFHTPRSVGAGRSGFDPYGYPVSPGGTVIRPPPGPPPLVGPVPPVGGLGEVGSGSVGVAPGAGFLGAGAGAGVCGVPSSGGGFRGGTS